MFYRFSRMLLRIFFYVVYRLKAEGRHNIPSEGPVIICANHINLLDPPLVGTPIERKISYMAKEELFRVPILGAMIKNYGAFPVKRGGVGKETIRTAVRLLEEGALMGIFPEGTRRSASGMGKKGAASLALRSGAVVVPAAIIGNYVPFKQMKIVYGPPVDLDEFREVSSSQGLEGATDKIMQTIRDLVKKHQ
jgi:1-acyl-sn-glycerol-3-phosphate acyltransferase